MKFNKFLSILKENNKTSLVKFDNSWSHFIEKIKELPSNISYEEACSFMGIPYTYFSEIIESSIHNWRNSTSTSLLNGIQNININNIPSGNIFKDLVWQTRFILMAKEHGLLHYFIDYEPIKGVNVKNKQAMTSLPPGILKINNIIRVLFLYWYLNHIKQVKLPKYIYRGIRAHDLYNHDSLKPLVDHIWKSDKTHEMKRKDVIDILVKWICDKKLHQITDNNILSFTSNINIAKYFSNGDGFCLRVDPNKIEIITSEIHDSNNLGRKDYMSNKNEKEYIIKIPNDYNFTPKDIIINDLEYFIAEQNPLCVELFDHDDKSASYDINGIHIDVYYYWKSNDNGLLSFTVNGTYGGSRIEVKKALGFDPLPTVNNIDNITNFKFKTRKRNWET